MANLAGGNLLFHFISVTALMVRLMGWTLELVDLKDSQSLSHAFRVHAINAGFRTGLRRVSLRRLCSLNKLK